MVLVEARRLGSFMISRRCISMCSELHPPDDATSPEVRAKSPSETLTWRKNYGSALATGLPQIVRQVTAEAHVIMSQVDHDKRMLYHMQAHHAINGRMMTEAPCQNSSDVSVPKRYLRPCLVAGGLLNLKPHWSGDGEHLVGLLQPAARLVESFKHVIRSSNGTSSMTLQTESFKTTQQQAAIM